MKASDPPTKGDRKTYKKARLRFGAFFKALYTLAVFFFKYCSWFETLILGVHLVPRWCRLTQKPITLSGQADTYVNILPFPPIIFGFV